jgi:phosphatidylglycerophosphate synthase
MSSRPIHLAIDARPRGPRGLLAAEVVLGRAVIGHLADLAIELAPEGEPVAVYARPEEHRELRELVGERARSRLVLVAGPPRADAAVLRTDRFYDRSRLRRRLGRGGSPEAAVLWRLDRPEALLAADEELTRRLTYQPIGRFWAFPLAQRLAEWLRPTPIRPNAVTASSAALMLAAALSVVAGATGPAAAAGIAVAMALALVLDTADGRLARLQGTSSAFGRWLDEFLDELVDLALHAAIAWSAFARHGHPVWLLLGIAYASGKYLFRVQSSLGDELEGRTSPRPQPPASLRAVPGHRARGIAEAVRLVGHADLRWHLWIVLAALQRLDIALVVYAIYFPVRTLAGAFRKGWRHA